MNHHFLREVEVIEIFKVVLGNIEIKLILFIIIIKKITEYASFIQV